MSQWLALSLLRMTAGRWLSASLLRTGSGSTLHFPSVWVAAENTTASEGWGNHGALASMKLRHNDGEHSRQLN